MSIAQTSSLRENALARVFSIGLRGLESTGELRVSSDTTMTKDRICGALGCRESADGYTYQGDVKLWTCLECADEHGHKVIVQ